jgi:hypothetical protein
VPVACPFVWRSAGSNGDSRSLDPYTPRSVFPLLRGHDFERIPKLTARVSIPVTRSKVPGLTAWPSAFGASRFPCSRQCFPGGSVPFAPEDLLRFARFRARPLPIYRAGRWSPPRAVLASGSGCSSRGLCPSSRSCRPLSTSTRRVLVGRGRGQRPAAGVAGEIHLA